MIKRLIKENLINSKPSSSVLSAVFVITAAGILSRLLGLLRDRFLAAEFGAGDALDIYYAAFRVPDLIYNLLILGALSAAFIPVFTDLISNEKENEAWKMAGGIMNLAVFFIIVFSLILAVLAPFLMRIITPGFSPEKIEGTVVLTRIMFLSPLLLGISGIFGGILTSFKRFLVYSIAPLFYNLGIIVGVLFFSRFLGVVGLAWGVVLGAFLHMVVQFLAVKNLGYCHIWKMGTSFGDKNVRKVLRLMIPRTLGIAVNQLNLFVITIFASTLAAGSLAIINLSQNLQGVPLGLFGSSFAIAVFPSLASFWAKKDFDNFVKSFSETFRQILFFVIPLSVLILVLRAQIVRVVLGAGKFDWEDTMLTFQVLGIFSLSLFAQSLIPLLARSFYSMHDTKTPFYIALFSEGINIAALLLLIGKFQVLGLAMAFSLSAIVQMLVLLFVLRSRFESLDDKNIILSILKVGVASVFLGLFSQAGKYISAWMLENSHLNFLGTDTFLGILFQLSFSVALGGAVFLIACQLLRCEEFLQFKKSLTRRIFRGKKQAIVEDISGVSGLS